MVENAAAPRNIWAKIFCENILRKYFRQNISADRRVPKVSKIFEAFEAPGAESAENFRDFSKLLKFAKNLK